MTHRTDRTDIEWVKSPDGSQGATWNPIRGCTRVSPGCGGPGSHGGCYAERVAARFSGPGRPYEGIAGMRGGKPRWTGRLAFAEHLLTLPLKRRKPTTFFVNSMSDLFHESVPDDWIDRVFAVMALCPQHVFQVLTKRSGRMRAYYSDPRTPVRIVFASRGLDPVLHLNHEQFQRTNRPLRDCRLGVSTEDQLRADERVPDLLATPAVVRFVSAEPLLGPIDFTRIALPGVTSPFDGLFGSTWSTDLCSGRKWFHTADRPRLDRIIVGDESGPNRREVDLDHVRSIRDQCNAAGTLFFLKQLHMDGKKVSLPELDGVRHFAMPAVTLRERS